MSEMVRKLAWHAATAFTDRTDVDEDTVQHFIPTVRAVLQAMMEPTREVLEKGISTAEDCTDSDWDSGPDGEGYNSYERLRSDAAFQIWKAMLTAALEDPRHG